MNKYREIFLDLERKILDGSYPAESLLPSENQLMQQYHVSRETIRKALNLLMNAGYIQKKQGKGSFVLDLQKFNFPISGLTSYKELQMAQHIPSATLVHNLSLEKVSAELAEITGWQVGESCWKLVRQRVIQDEVVILDTDYLLESIIPRLPLKQAENSVYEYLEQDLGLVISYAQKEVTVEKATAEDYQLMTLHEDRHVVVVRSAVFLEDTRCFQYTISKHRLDKFKFVDFARRRPIN